MGPSKHSPPLAGLHDVELAVMAASGGRAAFGELAKRHGSAVRGLLRRMGADPVLADDLAQDAFLSAFEHIAEFRGEGTFAGWIKRIAARLYIKRWKRRAQLDPLADATDFDSVMGGEGMAASLLDLDTALSALSPSERMCVSLCFGAGLSHVEAADALKAPLGTVKSHTRRGMAKLRARLAPDMAAVGPARRANLE
jgi:RNA polymerase sigma-70 factor (ECF subfamily)